MKIKTICLLGGTGFVGSELAAKLAADNHRLRLPTRNVAHGRALRVLPTVDLIAADVHDPATLRRLFDGCDAVVNLVGILNESGGLSFDEVHTALAEKVVTACKDSGVARFIQMSALKANAEDAPSRYLRSKGAAERIIMEQSGDAPAWTIFQPSVIFGPQDSFVNRFAKLLRLSPVLPLARPNARFAPVYVGDVVEAVALALDDPESRNRRFQLCGPKVYSLRELVQRIRDIQGLRRWIVGLPDPLARMQARVFEWLPGKPFTRDNFRSLTVHSICEQNGFEHFGLRPRSLESIAPEYIGHMNREDRLSYYRKAAGR